MSSSLLEDMRAQFQLARDLEKSDQNGKSDRAVPFGDIFLHGFRGGGGKEEEEKDDDGDERGDEN